MSSLIDIQNRVKVAVNEAVASYTAELAVEYKARRDKDRKNRTRAVKRVGTQWVEEYDLRVRHEPVHGGRDCHISIEGCSRRFHIQQHGSYRMFNPYDDRSRKINTNAKWWVYMYDVDEYECIQLGDHTNFESLVQQCICMMVGHAYYEASL